MRSLPRWPLVKLGLLLALIFVAAVTTAVLLLGSRHNAYQDIGKEIAKLAVQMLLITVAGGVVVHEYNRTRAHEAAVTEFLNSSRRGLNEFYSDVKKVRRILRARCELPCGVEAATPEEGIQYATYDELMFKLNDTQLDLERLKRELDAQKGTLSQAGDLAKSVRLMEKYLGEIISEYEGTLKQHRPPSCIPLSKVPRLRAFIAKGHESDFGKFSDAFHDALIHGDTQLLRDRLHQPRALRGYAKQPVPPATD